MATSQEFLRKVHKLEDVKHTDSHKDLQEGVVCLDTFLSAAFSHTRVLVLLEQWQKSISIVFKSPARVLPRLLSEPTQFEWLKD